MSFRKSTPAQNCQLAGCRCSPGAGRSRRASRRLPPLSRNHSACLTHGLTTSCLSLPLTLGRQGGGAAGTQGRKSIPASFHDEDKPTRRLPLLSGDRKLAESIEMGIFTQDLAQELDMERVANSLPRPSARGGRFIQNRHRYLF